MYKREIELVGMVKFESVKARELVPVSLRA